LANRPIKLTRLADDEFANSLKSYPVQRLKRLFREIML